MICNGLDFRQPLPTKVSRACWPLSCRYQTNRLPPSTFSHRNLTHSRGKTSGLVHSSLRTPPLPSPTLKHMKETNRRRRQLEQALDTRGVISNAVGILMAQEAVNRDDAFGILRTTSQTLNIKLRVIAEGIVDKAEKRGPKRA